MASRCAGVLSGQVWHGESSPSTLFFPGGLPALPFRNLPKSGGFLGSYQKSLAQARRSCIPGAEGSGRAAKGGEQLRGRRAPGPVGRERGNGGRPIARGHSPAPRGAQNSGSRNGSSSSRRVKRKVEAMPASSRRRWAGRARPPPLEPGVRWLCQPRGRGSR